MPANIEHTRMRQRARELASRINAGRATPEDMAAARSLAERTGPETVSTYFTYLRLALKSPSAPAAASRVKEQRAKRVLERAGPDMRDALVEVHEFLGRAFPGIHIDVKDSVRLALKKAGVEVA